MIRLTQHVGDQWVVPEISVAYPSISPLGRIDTIEAFGLKQNELYRLEVFKDSYSEHDQIENVEMGERYAISFSLKIDFSEFDDKAIADNLQQRSRDFLPRHID